MLAVVDIGNTRITIGIFDNENLLEIFNISTLKELSEIEYEFKIKDLLKNYKIDSCIIASVVECLSLKLKNAFDNIYKIKAVFLSEIDEIHQILADSDYKNVGADRLANVYGAYKIYNHSAIIVDAGTATTFDIVSNNGKFLGGIIMPGLETQLKSLNINTYKLPKTELSVIEKTIGHDTQSCILSGVLIGSVCAIDGLIERCKKELNDNPVIILTGGYSELLSTYVKNVDYVDINLTLKGLAKLYKSHHKIDTALI